MKKEAEAFILNSKTFSPEHYPTVSDRYQACVRLLSERVNGSIEIASGKGKAAINTEEFTLELYQFLDYPLQKGPIKQDYPEPEYEIRAL